MFLPDARSYPPGAPAAIGIEAIHAMTVDFLKAGITEFREETTAIYGNAEQVVDEGIYVLTYGEGVTERGKYINVWKQVNGSWRITGEHLERGPAAGDTEVAGPVGALVLTTLAPPTCRSAPSSPSSCRRPSGPTSRRYGASRIRHRADSSRRT